MEGKQKHQKCRSCVDVGSCFRCSVTSLLHLLHRVVFLEDSGCEFRRMSFLLTHQVILWLAIWDDLKVPSHDLCIDQIVTSL